MIEPAIILPAAYAGAIVASGRDYGTVDIKWSATEQLALVDGFHIGHHQGGGRTAMVDLTATDHFLAGLAAHRRGGYWYRVEEGLHWAGIRAQQLAGAIDLDAFKRAVLAGWRTPAPEARTFALTCARLKIEGAEVDHWVGWLLDPANGAAHCCGLEVAQEGRPLLEPLAGSWPLAELADSRVVLIGLGSIGSAAAEALASYGIRHLDLVDPDRLETHNFARHRANWRQLGRLKVNAMRARMLCRDPALDIAAHPLNVIYDADQMRPLLAAADLVVVCTDGVAPRSVANHLARRAGKPAVLACVLENGAYAELHRLQPGRTGCLTCARRDLAERGGIDPEPSLDRSYGEGTRHLPMTAVTGDLGIVGDLAAKITVATLLEPLGFLDQRLAGDHAVMALRPKPLRAEPFDLQNAGELTWRPLPPPRADCPSCSP